MKIPTCLHGLALTTFLTGPLAAATFYTNGHGDITATYSDGKLNLSYRLDDIGLLDVNGTPGNLSDDVSVSSYPGGVPILGSSPKRTRFNSTEIITYVPAPSLARPAGAAWDFIGTDAGDPLWYIPQVQDFAKPWLGFSSEELGPNWSSYTLSLVSITGPASGEFSLTTTGTFGGNTVYWSTSNGIDSTDIYNIGLNTHAHANWWFTEPGTYELTLRANGVHVTDGPKEAFGTFTFAVQSFPVPEPSTSLLALLAGAGSLGRRRRTAVR